MRPSHRVVWTEGLLLSPHHFQQWDYFHEAQQIERASLGASNAWGVHSLEIDTESLARGDFRLLSFRGILPSGALVRSPEFDPIPSIETFQDAFDVRDDSIDVLLGLPFEQSGWPNFVRPGEVADGAGAARYSIASVTVEDASTGRNDRSIERAEQNLKVLFSTSPRENYETIPIARVTRTASGDYRLAEDFIPPALSLKASPYLHRLARTVLERLGAASSDFSKELGGFAGDVGVTPANLESFLKFSMINGNIPLLAHLREQDGSHPEILYRQLAGLIGQLATFSRGAVHPREVPAYRHDDLGTTFSKLQDMLDGLLKGGIVQKGYDVIPINREADERLGATIQSDALLESGSAIYLCIGSDELPEQSIRDSVKGGIIVASPDRLQQKIATRVPGVPLTGPLRSPPPQIPRRSGTLYYQITSDGDEWEAIRASRGVAIHLPPELRDTCQFELIGVRGK